VSAILETTALGSSIAEQFLATRQGNVQAGGVVTEVNAEQSAADGARAYGEDR